MKKLQFLINRNPIFDRCPSCKDLGTLQKSRPRGTKEKVTTKLTFWKTYRCKVCGWRGYRSQVILTSRSLVSLVYYVGIIAFVAFVVYKVLNNFNN